MNDIQLVEGGLQKYEGQKQEDTTTTLNFCINLAPQPGKSVIARLIPTHALG